MTQRDWRAGELTMLLLALLLAVAALSSVGFLADRLNQGLERDARQMIGADFIVQADHPVPAVFRDKAQALGLRSATTAIFPSMVRALTLPALAVPSSSASSASSAVQPASQPFSQPSSQPAAQPVTRLAALKAVSPGYPLRGALRIADGPNLPDRPALSIPAPGTVWADAALLDALKLQVGDKVQIGQHAFTIGALITREMDRGFAFVNFSPRLMLRADDLPATGLITYGSRVTYRLLVAGPDLALAQYAAWAHAEVDGGKLRGVALESLQDGQPQVRQTLERARHFLTLVALLTALLASVAIAMAAHRYMRRHLDGCAVMRCLGMSQAALRTLFALEFLALGLIGGLAGVMLGFAGHLVLLRWLGSLIDVALPAARLWPALQGVVTGLVLLLGFALPPLVPLTRVSPLRVLRREWGEAGRTAWLAYGLGIALFAALLVLAAGEIRLGGIVAGGFAVGLLLFAGVAQLALWVAARLARSPRLHTSFGWRYALASLERRRGASALQITALGIGLMCLLLIAMTRNDLIEGWRQASPPDAPNQFLIDIQPDQREALTRYLADQGVPGVVLSPMVRARLVAINGHAVNPDSYKTSQARRLVDREFSLSYTTHLPDDNRIAAGTWFGTNPQAQISLEQGLAKTLELKLGDQLRFDVAGQTLEAPVTSLRKLDWGSFKANFFVLMPPEVLQAYPATFMSAFHLPARQRATIDRLIDTWPNLTAIDTAPILTQVQQMLAQVIGAVQFLFVFTLAAGLLVLYAALAGSRDERMRESALLRALGASHRQVRAVQVAEFIAVGALAGLLAALGAQAIGWVLATYVFDFHLAFNLWLLPVGMAAGVGCAGLGGWLSLRHVLRRSAWRSLREG
ncbi:ABC transporter permease [Paraburkholderia hayleyella]|uniref:ABC transporter permease n=1 Tax=Paraburkholderia hayleyella TaxID=2152889 RepID=UPI0012921906|nr:FtsX-like permease family protein [Paraburkholderia hayleyella]